MSTLVTRPRTPGEGIDNRVRDGLVKYRDLILRGAGGCYHQSRRVVDNEDLASCVIVRSAGQVLDEQVNLVPGQRDIPEGAVPSCVGIPRRAPLVEVLPENDNLGLWPAPGEVCVVQFPGKPPSLQGNSI